eukprot:1159952-Pelagomonas_calceolata.AAC.2
MVVERKEQIWQWYAGHVERRDSALLFFYTMNMQIYWQNVEKCKAGASHLQNVTIATGDRQDAGLLHRSAYSSNIAYVKKGNLSKQMYELQLPFSSNEDSW